MDRPSQLDFSSLMQSEDIEIELLGQPTDENVCINKVQYREKGLLMMSVFQEYIDNEATESPVEEVSPPSDAEPTDNDIDELLPKEVTCEINIAID